MGVQTLKSRTRVDRVPSCSGGPGETWGQGEKGASTSVASSIRSCTPGMVVWCHQEGEQDEGGRHAVQVPPRPEGKLFTGAAISL